jgi:hypothetical protein
MTRGDVLDLLLACRQLMGFRKAERMGILRGDEFIAFGSCEQDGAADSLGIDPEWFLTVESIGGKHLQEFSKTASVGDEFGVGQCIGRVE